MALAQLIGTIETKDPEGNITTSELIVEFNATPSQGVSRKTDVTNHPIERNNRAKSSITDHISANPNQINLDIILSDFDELESPATVSDKMDILERWQKDGTLLRYDGNNRIDDDVLIVALGDTFATTSGEALIIKLSLLKIRIAEAETDQLRIPKTIRKTQKQGRTESEVKVMPGETEADSEENKTTHRSILKSVF